MVRVESRPNRSFSVCTPRRTYLPPSAMHSASVEIVPVRTRRDRNCFFQFPWRLYRNDPLWVPPLRSNQLELLNYKPCPFYETGEIQTFYARRNGEVVGRIAAIIDGAHNDYYHERRGMFGFFESIDDTAVASRLFDAARQWLSDRGMQAMRGPANPSQNYEWGLLIEGFDRPPTFMMTYNPPYYQTLYEQYGLQKAQDMYAFWGHVDMLASLDQRLAFVADESARRLNLTVRPLDPRRFRQDVRTFMEIYNRALPGQWGFVPLSSAELDHLAAGLKHLIVPELTTIAEIDGKAVGAVFGILDYNPLIKKIDGRLFPFGFLHLLWQRRNLKRVRLVSTNVLPEYQKWGVGLVLMKRLIADALKFGIEEGEFSWVLESNHLSRKTLERGGAKRINTFRIYDLDLL